MWYHIRVCAGCVCVQWSMSQVWHVQNKQAVVYVNLFLYFFLLSPLFPSSASPYLCPNILYMCVHDVHGCSASKYYHSMHFFGLTFVPHQLSVYKYFAFLVMAVDLVYISTWRSACGRESHGECVCVCVRERE